LLRSEVGLVGDKVTVGAVPVPLTDTLCGLPVALSVMVMAPVQAPVAVGVKVTRMGQLAPAARLPPQVFVSLKSLVWMLVIVSVAVPELLNVTVCGLLLVPTN
jgi:hypothetical protein